MVVEFKFNVETSDYFSYKGFIEDLRRQLGVRSSHNLPVLAVQQEPPTGFFDLVLRTNHHAVRFRLRMDNLYLLGYQMENGQWLEFDNDGGDRNRSNQRNQRNQMVHLIKEPRTNFLGFNGNYDSLSNTGKRSIEDTAVGFQSLISAINQLAVSADMEARARSLVVVIMMICESTRLIPVFDHMAHDFYRNRNTTTTPRSGGRNEVRKIPTWIINLVGNWETMSEALLRADAYPEERFEYLKERNIRIGQPCERQIRNIEDAAAILGILLGLIFRPKPK